MNQRRLSIMRILDARKKFTARELAERFSVSIRTIQRDLEALQQLGFPLYAEAGSKGGYQVLPNRILPPLQLTQQEALGLFAILKAMEKVTDFPYGAARDQLSEQYYAALPSDVQQRIDEVRQHLIFELGTVGPAAASKYTTQILEAAAEKRELRFTYSSRSGFKEANGYPLGIVYNRGYWYMPARRGDKILLYRVDRMTEISETGLIDPNVPTMQEWRESPSDESGVEVNLEFTEFGARLASGDELFHPLQDRRWVRTVAEEELPYTARKLLAFGPEVKVHAPAKLQEMVISLLKRSLRNYQEV